MAVAEAPAALPAQGGVSTSTDRSKLAASVTGFTCDVQIEYPSEALATCVMSALAVDKELQPDKVKREMTVQGPLLSISFTAVEARFLRASFSAFMDILVLATRTIEQFGPSSAYGKYCQL